MKKEGACTPSSGRVRGDDEGRRRGPRREAKLETRREAEERRETTDGKNQDIRIRPVYGSRQRTRARQAYQRPSPRRRERCPEPYSRDELPYGCRTGATNGMASRHLSRVIYTDLRSQDWFTREDDSPHKEVTVKLTISLVL